MNFIKIKFNSYSHYKIKIVSFILLFLIGDFFYIRKVTFEEKKEILLESSNTLSNQLNIIFEQNKSLLLFIARKLNNKESVNLNYINKLLISSGELKIQSLTSSYISWATSLGHTIVSGKTGILKKPYVSIEQREYFLKCKKLPWTIQISNPTKSLFSSTLVLPTAMGVTDKNGVFLGYLLLGLRIKDIAKLLSTVISPNIEFVFSYKNQPTFSSLGISLASFSEKPSIIYSNDNIRHNIVLKDLPFVLHTTFKPGYIQSSLLNLMMKQFCIITILLLSLCSAYYIINNKLSKQIISIINKNNKKNNVCITQGLFLEDLMINERHLQKTLEHLNSYLSEVEKEREHYHSMNLIINTSEKEWKKLVYQINNNIRNSIDTIYKYLDIIITDEKSEYNEILKNLKRIIFKIKNLDYPSTQTKKLDINDLIQKSIIINKIRSFNKDIIVSHENPICLEDVQGDELEYQQIISSLINFSIANSRKKTKILIKTAAINEKEGKLLHVQFIFKGFGLSPEEIENITSSFNQQEKEFVDPATLKMSRIKHLINKYNGILSFDSSDEEISFINVYFPIDLSEQLSNKEDNNIISKKFLYH